MSDRTSKEKSPRCSFLSSPPSFERLTSFATSWTFSFFELLMWCTCPLQSIPFSVPFLDMPAHNRPPSSAAQRPDSVPHTSLSKSIHPQYAPLLHSERARSTPPSPRRPERSKARQSHGPRPWP